MVTRREVAALAGVSVATVSNVFLGKPVSPGKAVRVREAAEQLNYVPNHTARSLSLGRNNHIGIVLHECTNPYHMEIVRSIEENAVKRDYMVTVFLLENALSDNLNLIKSRKMDALINMSTDSFPEKVLQLLFDDGTVLADFGSKWGVGFAHPYTKAIEAVFARLSEGGHKTVGYVSTLDRLLFSCDERGIAFEQGRRRHGMCPDADLIEYNQSHTVLSEEVGYNGFKQLFARRNDLTAVFCTNDMAAIGVLRAAADLGLSVPDDLSVIGCDDVNLASMVIPRLTSLHFDREEFGRLIAGEVIRLNETRQTGAGQSFGVEVTPVFRDSLGPARRSREA